MPRRIDRDDVEIKNALRRHGGLVAEAAHALGMSPRTLGRRLARSSSLRDFDRDLHQEVSDVALHTIISRIVSGDPRAAMWWLVRRDPRFSLQLSRSGVRRAGSAIRSSHAAVTLSQSECG